MASQLFAKKLSSTSLFTIKGKLLFSALSEIMLLLIFTIFLIFSSRQLSEITLAQTQASTVVQTITEIRFVTFENLLHHDERSYNQWVSKHEQLGLQLEKFPYKNSHERLLLGNIKTQQKEIEPVFAQLVASYAQTDTGQNIVARNQYQERLASQLVSKQQIEISSAFKLSDLKREQALMVRQRTSSLAVGIITSMVAITIINFLFVYASITRALAFLQEGAHELSKGKFDYRIKYKRKSDEFGMLASTFNNMAANLEQVDKVKSEFILLVSHQLRTPATAVKGFISLLANAYNSGLSKKQLDMLASAYEENERQIKLINEILAIAQVETGEMILNKRPTDMAQLVKSIFSEQSLTLQNSQQKTVLHTEGKLIQPVVDTEKVRIILENLISNACKFSPPKSKINVRVRQTAKVTFVEVTDEGHGIAAEDLDKLFKKFSRVSNEDTIKTEGTGLGLFLAQRIAHLHGGEINVSSLLGRGTTFTVQLPNNTKG